MATAIAGYARESFYELMNARGAWYGKAASGRTSL
jgi:hypothetical protein